MKLTPPLMRAKRDVIKYHFGELFCRSQYSLHLRHATTCHNKEKLELAFNQTNVYLDVFRILVYIKNKNSKGS